MSGGRFEYVQYRLTDALEIIDREIERSGRPKTAEEMKNEFYHDSEWYEKYPDDKFHYKYPDEVIAEFKKGLEIIEKAQVYMQRIDWLLSGDDGEETFIERLNRDLSKLKYEKDTD